MMVIDLVLFESHGSNFELYPLIDGEPMLMACCFHIIDKTVVDIIHSMTSHLPSVQW